MTKVSEEARKYISHKISKIKEEGLSKMKGKKVSNKQRIAVALSMAREKGYKVPKAPKHNWDNESTSYRGPGMNLKTNG